jgi:hypothetical protein
MSSKFPDWFMTAQSPSQTSPSGIEDEPETAPKTAPKAKHKAKRKAGRKAKRKAGPKAEPKAEPNAEPNAEPKAGPKAEPKAREDHNSKSSKLTPHAVEESPDKIRNKLRLAVFLVDTFCLEASLGYIQEFMTAFENRDEKDHDTELGRRCYRIYKENKATDSLRANTGIICRILQIQASSIALLLPSTPVVDSRIQKLCIVAKRIETALEVFKSPKVDNEDSRLRAVFVSGILYCRLLHRENEAGNIHAIADTIHKGKFNITEA